MFERLQKKWKVSGWQMFLILIIFALGGSITGYAGRKLMSIFEVEMIVLNLIIYLVVITFIWPMAVLAVSIPFGQFSFFKKYISRIGRRFFNRKKD
jgi:hypothetical protein